MYSGKHSYHILIKKNTNLVAPFVFLFYHYFYGVVATLYISTCNANIEYGTRIWHPNFNRLE